jgi:CubicO group peptidase (beta-lactamase class C family)
LAELNTTPGAAIGVMQGSRVLLAYGIGFRDLQQRLPITPDTRFYIASTTKAFTAQAVLELAARGRIHLDSSLAAYVPALRFQPPLDARMVSVRDLLAHRSGLSSAAGTFLTAYSGDFTDSSLQAVIARAVARPRTFAYSNVNYVLTGYAIKGATGLSWQAAIDSLVVVPLDLPSTSFSLSDRGTNVAAPYAYEVDGPRPLTPKGDATMHAGGGMVSSLNDLLRWLRVVAAQGLLDGHRVLSLRTVEQSLAPQASVSSSFGGFQRWGYGLGWYLATYQGHDIVQCLGGFPGYRAHVSFDPKSRIGVVALVNEGRASAFLTEFIAQTIYDVMFELPSRDQRFKARIAEYRALIPRLRGTDPPTDLSRPWRLVDEVLAAATVGTYRNADYGTATVTSQDGGLVLRIGATSSFLEQISPTEYRADLLRGALEGPRTVLTYGRPGQPIDSIRIDLGSDAAFTRIVP